MRQGEGVTSVHFPKSIGRNDKPRASNLGQTPEPAARPEVNILEVFANAYRDAEHVRDRLRGLLTSESRHGDLQAALSANKRLTEYLLLLIGHEEQQ